MSKAPIIVSTKDIRPLPKLLLDSACAFCNRPQAKWELVGEGFVCSSCFLYRSAWAKELGRRNQVDDLVLDIEGQVHENFKRTSQGELVEVGTADRVAAAIVLTSRMFSLHERLGRVRE